MSTPLSKLYLQETLNFWKQISHVMKYFKETENPDAKLPQNFMQSFLEVRQLDDERKL